MSGSLNKVMLIGRIASDPKLKSSPSGSPSLTFSFATNARWRDQSGEMKNKASFHYLRLRGKRAETLEQYLKKGKELFVEGEISYEEWGEGDKKKPVTVINVLGIEMIGGPGQEGGDGGRRESRPSSGRRTSTSEPDPDPTSGDELDDDIPF